MKAVTLIISYTLAVPSMVLALLIVVWTGIVTIPNIIIAKTLRTTDLKLSLWQMYRIIMAETWHRVMGMF